MCGLIVCAECSKGREHLKVSRSGQVKRVCDTCVQKIRMMDATELAKAVDIPSSDESDSGLIRSSEEESKGEEAIYASSLDNAGF